MKPKIKPRNPLVADAKFRKAGVHEKSEKARRRQEKLALAKAAKALPEPGHKRPLAQAASVQASFPDQSAG